MKGFYILFNSFAGGQKDGQKRLVSHHDNSMT